MSRSIHTWYRVFIIALIGSCALGGIVLVSTAGYELTIVFHDASLESKIVREIHLIEEVDCFGYKVGNHTYRMGHACNRGENEAHTGPLESEGAQKFKLILIIVLITSIILGFTQFLTSFFVVCACNTERIRSHVKGWILGATFIFLFGLLALMVSLSYDVSNSTHFNLNGLSSYIKKKFEKLVRVREWEELGEDLFLYVLGCNQSLLLVTILVLMALIPCGTQPYQSIYGE